MSQQLTEVSSGISYSPVYVYYEQHHFGIFVVQSLSFVCAKDCQEHIDVLEYIWFSHDCVNLPMQDLELYVLEGD